MLKKFIFDKYFTKKHEMGGIVNAYAFEIPQHDEFYLINEFKQAFKVFGMTIHIPVEITTFLIPTEFQHILHMWNEAFGTEDGFNSDKLDELITNSFKTFKSAYKDMASQIDKIPDETQRKVLSERLTKNRDKVEMMYGKWTKDERMVNASFINSGYVPMYRVNHGSTSMFFLGRYIDDRLVLISTDFMKFKDKLVLQNVKQTYMTDDMVKAYFAKIEKGVK